MAEGMPPTEQPSLHEMLADARVRQGLPENTTISAEDSLIAGTSRGSLIDAIHRAIAANKTEELNFSLMGMRFAEAARHLRWSTGAPSREFIEPSEAGRAPDVLSLYELLSDGSSDETGYATVSDPEMVAAAVGFDAAGRDYDVAFERKKKSQPEAKLANEVRARQKRLSLVPRVLIVALSTALLGGGSYVVSHDLQTHAQEQLAKQPEMLHDSERYEALRRDASPVQTDLLSAVGLLAGIGVGVVAAWGAESEVARRRAIFIIRHAPQVNSSAGPPDELPEVAE